VSRVMRVFGMLAAVLAVVITGCEAGPAAGSGEKIQLRLNVKKGESIKLRVSMEQDISQTIGDMKQDMEQTVVMTMTYNIVDVAEDGTATINASYDGVVYRNDGPLGLIEYDSDKSEGDAHPLAGGFAALVGKSFTMMMTPTGEVTQVQGIEEMLDAMIEDMGVPDGPEKEMMREQMKKQFGDEAMKNQVRNMVTTYPEKPVGVGDTWTEKVADVPQLPIVITTTYTFKSRSEGIATLEVESEVTPNPDAEPVNAGMARISYDLSGEMNGTMEIEEATGWTRKASVTQELSGTAKMLDSPTGEDMSWPISIESVVTIELLEKRSLTP
jgi:hypothetical protein